MFAKTTNVGFAQRVVATLVACAVLLWSLGAYVMDAQAANLASVSDLLSTSNPGVTSAHQIAFTIPPGSSLGDGDTVTITFPVAAGEFVIGNLASGDVTVTVAGGGDPFAAFATTSASLSFNSVSATAGQEVIVAIADGKITNPTATTSHEIVVSTGTDTGKTRIAIVDTVLVTAIVETVFDFNVFGLATGTQVYGVTASTTGSSSPTALDFATLSADTPEALGQRLTVQTNADAGFVVTVQTDGDFASANGAIIDSFSDGSDISDTGTAWAAPGDDIADETTWGHWGFLTNDNDLSAFGYYTEDFGTSTSFIAASTTPREVFHHDGPSDASTNNAGFAEVLYKVEITPLQEAADDYQTVLTYIATPTF